MSMITLQWCILNVFSVCSVTWWKTPLKTFLVIFSSSASENRRCVFVQIGILSFCSFHNVPSLKRQLIHHTTQRACRRQFVGLPDHLMRSNHLWLQYRKTLLWYTVDVRASTFTQYASHGRYFKLLKRCIKLSRFNYHCLWMKHWSGGGLGGVVGIFNIKPLVIIA